MSFYETVKNRIKVRGFYIRKKEETTQSSIAVIVDKIKQSTKQNITRGVDHTMRDDYPFEIGGG